MQTPWPYPPTRHALEDVWGEPTLAVAEVAEAEAHDWDSHHRCRRIHALHLPEPEHPSQPVKAETGSEESLPRVASKLSKAETAGSEESLPREASLEKPPLELLPSSQALPEPEHPSQPVKAETGSEESLPRVAPKLSKAETGSEESLPRVAPKLSKSAGSEESLPREASLEKPPLELLPSSQALPEPEHPSQPVKAGVGRRKEAQTPKRFPPT